MGSKHDLIIIGAGWYGLVAAKVYLELHPSEEILILEAESSCGGTWSANRLYSTLKSNNLLDTCEYPDFPMSPERYDVEPGEHIPGPVLHLYLTDFSKKFGNFARTQFNTKVEGLEPTQQGEWSIMTEGESGRQTFETKKVIIATGLIFQPNFPIYPGVETFGAPYFHAKDSLSSQRDGAGKSAMDVAYAYAVEGTQMDLVVRPNGKGPIWISYPWVMRAIRRFIVDEFWAGLGGEVVEKNGYATSSEFKKLQPWNSAFWIGSALSILNYDVDFFDMIKNGTVNVHVADVDRLTQKTVHLTDGQELKADVLVCATGWQKDPSIRFLKFGTAGIGLPQTPAEQKMLATDADSKILNLYPRLRDQPPLNLKPSSDRSRLYRFIVPPARADERNIAFAGMVSSVIIAATANAQALWIFAFLDGRLARMASTPEEITEEVMVNTQWVDGDILVDMVRA